MRSESRPRLHGLSLAAAGLLLGACAGGEPTIAGEIRDDAIVLEQATGPQSVWLQLSNVGATACDLVVIRTELPPDALPVVDGRVVLGQSSGPHDEAYPMEAYIEIDGEPANIADPVFDRRQAVVEPGQTARVQLALTGMPEREERVVACNAAGDYEAGRYTVLRFAR